MFSNQTKQDYRSHNNSSVGDKFVQKFNAICEKSEDRVRTAEKDLKSLHEELEELRKQHVTLKQKNQTLQKETEELQQSQRASSESMKRQIAQAKDTYFEKSKLRSQLASKEFLCHQMIQQLGLNEFLEEAKEKQGLSKEDCKRKFWESPSKLNISVDDVIAATSKDDS